MGKLEGANGSSKLVQSLWAGAQQLSTDLYVPRPLSGWLSSNDRDGVAVVIMPVVVVVIAPDRPEAFGLCDDGWRVASIATLPLAERLLN